LQNSDVVVVGDDDDDDVSVDSSNMANRSNSGDRIPLMIYK